METFAALNWSSYRYDTLAQSWRALSNKEYLADMDRRYSGAEPGEDPTEAAGRLLITQLYYNALHNGLDSLVKIGNQAVIDAEEYDASDSKLVSDLDIASAVTPAGVRWLVNKIIFNFSDFKWDSAARKFVGTPPVSVRDVSLYLGGFKGKTLKELADSKVFLVAPISDLKASFGVNTKGVGKGARFAAILAITAAFSIAAGVMSEGGFSEEEEAGLTLAVSAGVLVAFAVEPAQKLVRYTRDLAAASELGSSLKATKAVLGSGSEVLEMTFKGGAAGLVVDVGFAWAIFGATVASGGLKAGTVAYNAVLATALADTVIAILSFVLVLTSVGAIVVALVGFVDLLLLGLCAAGAAGTCFGLTDTVSKAISQAFYGAESTINFEHKDGSGNSDLINMGRLSLQLGTPQLGMTAGNTVRYSSKIETNIFHKRPARGGATYWPSLFTQTRLKETAFSYSLTSPLKDKLPAPAKGAMENQWRNVQIFDQVRYGHWALTRTVYEDFDFWTANAAQRVSTAPIPMTQGLNQQIPLWFNASYSAPGYECWTYDCDRITNNGTIPSSNLGTMVLDVLPATFDEFLGMNWDRPQTLFSLQPRLGWATQRDRDGDGLTDQEEALFGSNPGFPDSDNDGLSDKNERDLGTEPQVSDTDGDGLSDYVEILIGSDPKQADSDFDGLTDLSEVQGQSLAYASGKVTYVATDPTKADSDGDGMLDPTEFSLGFNPRVFKETIAIHQLINDADGFVRYGDSLTFKATVRNKFPRSISPTLQGITPIGSLVTTFGPALNGTTSTLYLSPPPGTELNTSIDFSVASGSGSRNTSISSTASGELRDFSRLYGNFSLTRSLPIRIDDDAPSGTLLTQIVRAGAINIIGGTATDPTSYITKVEVNVNNGGWVTAAGNDTARSGAWAFAWDAPSASGAYPVLVKATDAVGNIGSAAQFTIYVDDLAPTVTATAPTARFAARKDDQQRWVVDISGTATDPGSGPTVSGLQNVEVKLAAQRWRLAIGHARPIGQFLRLVACLCVAQSG